MTEIKKAGLISMQSPLRRLIWTGMKQHNIVHGWRRSAIFRFHCRRKPNGNTRREVAGDF